MKTWKSGLIGPKQHAVMLPGPAAGGSVCVKYLPWNLLIRHREARDFAAWVMKLSGIHMEPVFFL